MGVAAHPPGEHVSSLALPAIGLLAAIAVGACSSDGRAVVAVTSTDRRCVVAGSPIQAGVKTVRVANRGRKVTEVYVYSADGLVEGETENIGPGFSRTFTVDLVAGRYDVVCKPGMTGNGVPAGITVIGPGGDPMATPTASVVVSATDYEYHGLEGRSFASGKTVEIVMHNDAPDENHELEVFGPDGEALGEIGPTQPGRTGRAILTFHATGTYVFVCGVEVHEERGMSGRFTVR